MPAAYISRPMRGGASVRNVTGVSPSDGPRWGRPGLRPWLIDGAVVVVLVALMIFEASARTRLPSQHPYDLASFVLIAGMAVPYLGHRRLPMTMLVIELAAVLGYAFLHYTAFPGLNAFAMLFGIALHSDRRRSLIAFVATLTVMMVALGGAARRCDKHQRLDLQRAVHDRGVAVRGQLAVTPRPMGELA